MKFVISVILSIVSCTQGREYKYASSSFSSSASSIVTDGEGKVVHSSASAEEGYSEKDSKGLNRNGKGKYAEKDGKKIFESTKACEDDECISKELNAAKNHGVTLNMNEVKDFENLFPL